MAQVVQIDIEELAEKMEAQGYDPNEDPQEGWSYALIDSIQDMVDIETKVRKVFEKKYPNIKFV